MILFLSENPFVVTIILRASTTTKNIMFLFKLNHARNIKMSAQFFNIGCFMQFNYCMNCFNNCDDTVTIFTNSMTI